MRSRISFAVFRLMAGSVALLMAGTGYAKARTPDLWDGNWHYSITPYGWLPGISLTTRYQSPSGAVQNQTNNDIYSYLSGAFMLAGEARKGRWGLSADLDWVDFSNQKGRISSIGGDRAAANLEVDTRWDLRGNMVSLAGLYSLSHGSQGRIDVLFGARFLNVQGDVHWNSSVAGIDGRAGSERQGQASGHAHYADVIVGLKGAWTPFQGSRFFFPYYLDIGTGDAVRTYQITVGVAYRFDWGNIALGYRELEYHRSGGDQFLQKARLSGLNASATWVF